MDGMRTSLDYVIEHYRGVNIDSIEREQEGRRSISLTDNAYEAEELIEITYGYQRLIDPRGWLRREFTAQYFIGTLTGTKWLRAMLSSSFSMGTKITLS